jgi:hypothetical protein
MRLAPEHPDKRREVRPRTDHFDGLNDEDVLDAKRCGLQGKPMAGMSAHWPAWQRPSCRKPSSRIFVERQTLSRQFRPVQPQH